jgi:hypothetical protein
MKEKVVLLRELQRTTIYTSITLVLVKLWVTRRVGYTGIQGSRVVLKERGNVIMKFSNRAF